MFCVVTLSREIILCSVAVCVNMTQRRQSSMVETDVFWLQCRQPMMHLGKGRCHGSGWKKGYRAWLSGCWVVFQTINLKKGLLPSGHATTLPITQASSCCCRMSCRICSVWSFDTTRAAPTPQLNVLAISSSESCPSCCSHEKTLGTLQVQAS